MSKTKSCGTFTDKRDGKTYKTVKIGERVWMAENLAFDAKGSRCYGEGGKYGRLYSFKTAQKACPAGWHLPSREEWQELVDLAGGKEKAGKKLKAKRGWKNFKRKAGGNGTDCLGFAALPGGHGIDSNFCWEGNIGFWWLDKERKNSFVHYWTLGFGSDYAHYIASSEKGEAKKVLFSVRCVKD